MGTQSGIELIKAKFCDADDRPTPELKRFLDTAGSSLTGARIQCKSELENLAHALLRVKKVQEVLEKIASYDFTKMKRLVFSNLTSITIFLWSDHQRTPTKALSRSLCRNLRMT